MNHRGKSPPCPAGNRITRAPPSSLDLSTMNENVNDERHAEPVTLDLVERLHREHIDALLAAREAQRAHRGAHPSMKTQLDDVEAEITYLLLRHVRPAKVVEIGSLHGWSTSWLLRAPTTRPDGWSPPI